MINKLYKNKFKEPITIALGFFDSMHLGHRKLVQSAKEMAIKNNSSPCLFTFNNNPATLFSKDDKLIYTFSERTKILQNLDIKHIIDTSFNSFFSHLTHIDFLNNLINQYNVKGLVCGYDYRFGYDKIGDIKYLSEFCKLNSIDFNVVNPVVLNDIRVSTSYIKKLIDDGNIEQTNKFLGQNYFMQGKVIHGRGIGNTIGIPTANILIDSQKRVLKEGVYITKTCYNNKEYSSLTSIGKKPTFNDLSQTIETHILNFNGDIYDRTITIKFYSFLREIRKFATIDILINTIKDDILSLKTYFK